MTNEQLKPFVGKPVRLTLSNGDVLAGTLHVEDGHGHPHMHYIVESDPVQEGGAKVRALVHGADLIVQIEDASDDPAAVV